MLHNQKRKRKGETSVNSKNIKAAAAGTVILAAAAGGLYGLYKASQPEGRSSAGQKTITVEIIHANKEKKTVEITTDQAMLGDALQQEGLIAGEEGQYGLFVTEVDGEKADFDQNGSWWMLEENGQQAAKGADKLPVEDGATYSWIYSAGE